MACVKYTNNNVTREVFIALGWVDFHTQEEFLSQSLRARVKVFTTLTSLDQGPEPVQETIPLLRRMAHISSPPLTIPSSGTSADRIPPFSRHLWTSIQTIPRPIGRLVCWATNYPGHIKKRNVKPIEEELPYPFTRGNGLGPPVR